MVSIAGGEPLMHPQIDVIVAELIKRKKFVFLCTNALLLPKKLDKFKPSPLLLLGGAHRRAARAARRVGRQGGRVRRGGRRDQRAKARGFKVNTNTTFFNTDTPQTIIDVLDFLNDDLKVDEMMISPAYAYEKAPDQEHFLGVERDPGAVPQGLRGRAAEEVAAEPHAAVPGLPRGQDRLRLHRLGDPELLAARLAEALLPDGRRLRRRPTRSSSRPPTGTPTGGARTRAAPTAWRTAATSPRPCSPPWARCASPFARS